MLPLVRRNPLVAIAAIVAVILVVLAVSVLIQPQAARSAAPASPAVQGQATASPTASPPAPVPPFADATQTNGEGAVTVKVTPLNLQDSQAATIDFTVALDTHSVDLDMDLREHAMLVAGDQQVDATAWQPSGEGGHHVEGVLSFPATDATGASLLEGATTLTLHIHDLAGVAVRTFTWDRIGDVAPAADAPAQEPATQPGMEGHAMESAKPMTGSMPMAGDMAGMMPMMQDMMAKMGDMPMQERHAMMTQMMPMMQGMMAMMADMPMQERHAMMTQMMPMMQGMMTMMADMPMQERHDMMTQMMQGMMAMMADMHKTPASGMDGMDHDTEEESAEPEVGDMDHGAAHEHMAPIPSTGVPSATASVGGQPLAYREEDGVKVFELTAMPVRWTILESEEETVEVTAWTYNGTVPGPMIRVTEGDRVRIHLTNQLAVPTAIHWHGLPVPHVMDGVPPITQMAIQPGETFTYEFDAPPAGSFMYHSHVDSDVQVMLGLYAPFVVDPREPAADAPDVDVMWMLSEWRVDAGGETVPAMPMAGAEPNYFTINGKAFPSTEPIVVKQGERVRIRLAGIGQFVHPMHLHGMNFRVVAYDGVSLPPEQQVVRNTIPINPGELVDIEFVADNLGTWLFHCHVLHHLTNDNVEPGGLIGVIQVVE